MRQPLSLPRVARIGVRLLDKDQRSQPPYPDSPAWPPPEFRKSTGAYSQYAWPHEQQDEARQHMRTEGRDFHPLVRPEGDEAVVANGEELHRLCAQRGIVQLIYAGFYTNMCVSRRDYGVYAMRSRGYGIVLLRDCTTAMETYETQTDFGCTHSAIATMEQSNICTLTSKELITVLNGSSE